MKAGGRDSVPEFYSKTQIRDHVVLVRQAVALWLVLFAAYAATLGITAFADSEYGGDEPHNLLTAESIVSDGDFDLRDEYATRAYADWYPRVLERHGRLTDERANEPHGAGYPLLIAPAYALGGPKLVQLLMAAIAALAFVLAAALARRVVPDPWAWVSALVCGLSPPALAYSTAVLPELAAAAAVTGAALLAVRIRERPRIRWVAGCALLLGTLPWLGVTFVPAGVVIAAALVHRLRRGAPRFAVLVATEILIFSTVLYITINDRLYGGITPASAERPGFTGTDAEFPGGYADRAPRLVGLWLDRTYGALRWAPFAALAFYALYLLWRSHRGHLTRLAPERREVEATALLCALIAAAQFLVAALLTRTMTGFWFPGLHLMAALPVAVALCAWGLRHAPRAGSALAALTLGTSLWLYVELRIDGDGWIGPSSRAPLGPLDGALPLFGTDSAGAAVAVAVVVAGLAALVATEWRSMRREGGLSTRRR